MMYSGLPRRYRRTVKTLLSAAWLLGGAAGASAVLHAPTQVVRELGTAGTVIIGSIMVVTTVAAAYGVASARYRWEWVAAWLASAALSAYAITMWAFVFMGDLGRTTQAFLVTSLLTFFILRGFMCAAHAAKLRELHTIDTAAVKVVASGGSAEGGNTDAGT